MFSLKPVASKETFNILPIMGINAHYSKNSLIKCEVKKKIKCFEIHLTFNEKFGLVSDIIENMPGTTIQKMTMSSDAHVIMIPDSKWNNDLLMASRGMYYDTSHEYKKVISFILEQKEFYTKA